MSSVHFSSQMLPVPLSFPSSLLIHSRFQHLKSLMSPSYLVLIINVKRYIGFKIIKSFICCSTEKSIHPIETVLGLCKTIHSILFPTFAYLLKMRKSGESNRPVSHLFSICNIYSVLPHIILPANMLLFAILLACISLFHQSTSALFIISAKLFTDYHIPRFYTIHPFWKFYLVYELQTR